MLLSTHSPAVTLIKEARHTGRPIVPFLGAGFSVGSGFPTIERLCDYFAWVTFYSTHLSLPQRAAQDPASIGAHAPAAYIKVFGWPSFNDLQSRLWEHVSASLRDLHARRTLSLTHLTAATLALLSADLADTSLYSRYHKLVTRSRWGKGRWRLLTITTHTLLEALRTRNPAIAATLTPALWQMQRAQRGSQAWDQRLQENWWTQLLELTDGDLDYADLLFHSLERNRRPSTTHTLFAHLLSLLDVDIALTLNFDSLLEASLRDEHIPFRTFDIFRDASLPHERLLRSSLSLIKIHGSSYGLRMGERIEYALDADTQRRACNIITNDALLLIFGFSASERRMAQLLEALVRRNLSDARTHNTPPTAPYILWLHHSTRLPELVTDLRNIVARIYPDLNPDSMIATAQVPDIPTFALELCAAITGTPPTTRTPYRLSRTRIRTDTAAAPNQPSTAPSSGLPLHLDALDPAKCPEYAFVHLFFNPACTSIVPSTKSRPVPALRLSSHASLTLSAFVARCEQAGYTSIWIDFERHHTVADVVFDIFGQIKRVDPDIEVPVLDIESPILSLPIATPTLPETALQSPTTQVHRAAARLHNALRRGRYVIAFDSLESFVRPETVHHGVPEFTRVPTVNLKDALTDSLKSRLDSMLTFLKLLTCATIPKAIRDVVQHGCLADSYIAISLDVATTRTDPHDRPAHECPLYREVHDKLRDFVETLQAAANTTRARLGMPSFNIVAVSPDSPLLAFKEPSLTDLQRVPASNLACIVANGTAPITTTIYYSQDTIDAKLLLDILAIFRHPRSILAISQIAEDIFGAADPVPTAVEPFDARELPERLRLGFARLLELGFLRRMNGEFYWIPRSCHETAYAALTYPVTPSAIKKALGELPATAKDACTAITPLFVRLVFLAAMHRRAGRFYYTRAFLPSGDASEFFEFVYHRVSRLRYLTLLDAVWHAARERSVTIRDIEAALEKETAGAQKKATGAKEKGADGAVSWVRLLADLRHPSNDISITTLPAPSQRDIALSIGQFRLRDIVGLRELLARDFGRMRSAVAPDSLLGWINQLINHDIRLFDLRHIQDDLGVPRLESMDALEGWIASECADLRVMLLDYAAALHRDRGDYRQAVYVRISQLKELIDTLPPWLRKGFEIGPVPRKFDDLLKYNEDEQAFCSVAGALRRLLDAYMDALRSQLGRGGARQEGERAESLSIDEAGRRDILFRFLRGCDVLSELAVCLTNVVTPSGNAWTSGWRLFGQTYVHILQPCMEIIDTIRSDGLLSKESLGLLEARTGECQARIAVESCEALLRSVDAWEEVRIGVDRAKIQQEWRVAGRNEIAASVAGTAEEWEDVIAAGRFPSGLDYAELRARIQNIRARASCVQGDFSGAHLFLDTAEAWLRSPDSISAADTMATSRLFRAEACLLSVGRATSVQSGIDFGAESVGRQVRRLARAERELDAASSILSGRRPGRLWEDICLLRAELAFERLIMMTDTRMRHGEDVAGVFEAHCRNGLRAVIDALDCQIRYADEREEFTMRVERVLRRWVALYIVAFCVSFNEEFVKVWVSDFHMRWDAISRTMGFEVLVWPEHRESVNYYGIVDGLLESHVAIPGRDPKAVIEAIKEIITNETFHDQVCRSVADAVLKKVP